jgi:hypothetical protein
MRVRIDIVESLPDLPGVPIGDVGGPEGSTIKLNSERGL